MYLLQIHVSLYFLYELYDRTLRCLSFDRYYQNAKV